MIVGAAVVELHVHGSQSLKEKRGVVRSVVQRVRNRFNVSVAEIGGQDTWQRAVLGIATTGNDRTQVRDLLRRALEVPPVVHPVVRVHPVTGRRALFVNEGFTSHLVGLSRIESEGLLALLHRHTTQPELVLRHRWRPGDVVIWDNRATMHYAADDYGTAERRMRRVTLRGDASVGANGTVSHVVDDPLLTVR